MTTVRPGVSVVLCTRNGASRLGATLRHLLVQQVPAECDWEVVLVDNASTDNTTTVARQVWAEGGSSAELRLVSEPVSGLMRAREHGVAEARFSVIAFIDDDNHLAPNWLATAWELMEMHPEVGACGGRTEPEFDVAPPQWFANYHEQFAIGTQATQAGDVSTTRGYLWGAGLLVRRAAWHALWNRGFRPLTMGRSGTQLSSGEDAELCFALLLGGWRLWYDPGLCLKHVMPAGRLQWNYLRRLYRGFGVMSVAHDAYWSTLRQQPQRVWRKEVARCLRTLRKHWRLFLRSRRSAVEGSHKVIELDWTLARLQTLLRQPLRYGEQQKAIRNAPWHTVARA